MPIVDPTPQDLERWRLALIERNPESEAFIRSMPDFNLWRAHRHHIEKPKMGKARGNERKRYQAKVSIGSGQRISLGYFATPEERDAAIFAYRIGVKE